jgi:hypothetical protein
MKIFSYSSSIFTIALFFCTHTGSPACMMDSQSNESETAVELEEIEYPATIEEIKQRITLNEQRITTTQLETTQLTPKIATINIIKYITYALLFAASAIPALISYPHICPAQN